MLDTKREDTEMLGSKLDHGASVDTRAHEFGPGDALHPATDHECGMS